MSSAPSTQFILESGQILSRSMLWQLQYDYYAAQGINAWGQGQVPSYITSNTLIAHQYAEVVFGFFRDLHRKGLAAGRIYLLEPGAGSGQFAYLFVKTLAGRCASAAFPAPEFCYILSDFAESNVEFWESHPKLRAFVARGQVDFAVFDASKDRSLKLRVAGTELQAGSLQTPLVVLANYFFDSIPQDLFFLEDGQLQEALPELTIDGPHPSKNPSRLLKSIEMDFELRDTDTNYYPEPAFNHMLAHYTEVLPDAWLLFPAPALRMLDALRSWTTEGLLLLTGDKGVQYLDELRGLEKPELIVHGGFSLTVNYHAFHQYALHCQGLALMPAHVNYHLNVHGLLFREDGADFGEMQRAYADTIGSFGPDDFFLMGKVLEKRIRKMKWPQLMAAIRHSHYDPNVFQNLLPRIQTRLTGLLARERATLLSAIARVWENYYPIRSGENLATDLAKLAFLLDDYEGTLKFLEYAMQTAPQEPEIYFSAALCYDQLEQYDDAEKYLRLVVQMDADHREARELLADYAQAAEA